MENRKKIHIHTGAKRTAAHSCEHRHLQSQPVLQGAQKEPPAVIQIKTSYKLKCYNCNETGHITKNCPQPVICRTCKQTGHKAGDPACPVPSEEPPTLNCDAPLEAPETISDGVSETQIASTLRALKDNSILKESTRKRKKEKKERSRSPGITPRGDSDSDSATEQQWKKTCPRERDPDNVLEMDHQDDGPS